MNMIFDKFPPKRKDEFLKYVLLTVEQRAWCGCVRSYMKFYKLKDWREGFDFIIKWTSDRSITAIGLWVDGHINIDWVLPVIEDDEFHNALEAVYYLIINKMLLSPDFPLQEFERKIRAKGEQNE